MEGLNNIVTEDIKDNGPVKRTRGYLREQRHKKIRGRLTVAYRAGIEVDDPGRLAKNSLCARNREPLVRSRRLQREVYREAA